MTVVLLLLVQFLVRSHNIQAQEAYVDEGYHIVRASEVWDFATNPASFSHGKVLTYYWLGLFESAPTTALVTGRLSIALFSLVTGASLYLIGRLLGSHSTGVIALGIYSVLPLAVIFERMTLADPFANGLACLAVWRGMVLARRPALRQGVIVGALMALATMAKLTMVGLPAIIVGMCLIYYRWDQGIRQWVRTYSLPLISAAFTVLVLWSPLLVPAYLAPQGDGALLVVDPETVQRDTEYAPNDAADYVIQVGPLLAEMTSPILMVMVAIAAGLGILWGAPETQRWGLVGILWIGALALPVIGVARVVTCRYLMPLAVPGTLLVALGVTQWWRSDLSGWRRYVGGGGFIGLFGGWLVLFAVPFLQDVVTDPQQLDLTGNNRLELQSGLFTAGDRTREAVTWLEHAEVPGPVYATREACHLMYFFTDSLSLHCLEADPIPHTGEVLLAELEPGEIAYFVESWFYGPFHLGIDWLAAEEITLQTPPRYGDPFYEFRLWKIWIPET